MLFDAAVFSLAQPSVGVLSFVNAACKILEENNRQKNCKLKQKFDYQDQFAKFLVHGSQMPCCPEMSGKVWFREIWEKVNFFDSTTLVWKLLSSAFAKCFVRSLKDVNLSGEPIGRKSLERKLFVILSKVIGER